MNIITLILTCIFLIYEMSVFLNAKKYFKITIEGFQVKNNSEELLNHLKRNILLYRVTILYWIYLFYGLFTPQYKYFLIILGLSFLSSYFKRKYLVTFYIDALITIAILFLIIKVVI